MVEEAIGTPKRNSESSLRKQTIFYLKYNTKLKIKYSFMWRLPSMGQVVGRATIEGT